MSDFLRKSRLLPVIQVGRLRKTRTDKSNSNRSQRSPIAPLKRPNILVQKSSRSSIKPIRLRADRSGSNPKRRKRHRSEGYSDRQSLKHSESDFSLKQTEEKEALISRIIRDIKITGLPPQTTSSFYNISQKLGKGAFGKVYLAIHVLTGLQVAIKTIDKSRLQNESSKLKVFQEVHLMRKINHQNVVRLLEVFETHRFYMIVLEYADNGDLLKMIKSKFKIPEKEAKPLFTQIVHGLLACHSKNIIHRDIKLDNILLTKELRVKICDFGVSRTVKDQEVINEQCGTPAYLAPEIIINRGYVGKYVDIWSLGVLLYAMLSGTVPFKAQTLNELHKLILLGSYNMPEHLSQEAVELIQRMLCPVPFQRIRLEEILRHPWVDGVEIAKNVGGLRSKRSVILGTLQGFGYSREYIEQSLKIRDINHATATYNILDLLL